MPMYSFCCQTEEKGCGNNFEKFITMKDYDEQCHKVSCPNCKKTKSVCRDFSVDIPMRISTTITLGSLAEKNSDRMSDDHKESLRRKHNEYKENRPNTELPEGMTRGKDLL